MGWKQQIATTFFSHGFVRQIKRELFLFGCRVRCFALGNLIKLRRFRKLNQSKLNIGAGKQDVPGWIAIDLVNVNKGLRWDVRWGLPFKDGSVKKIHCEHFLEHLEYPSESEPFLRECFRVLSHKGEGRFIVPDAGKYIMAYNDNTKDFWDALSDLGGSSKPFETEMEIMNQAFRMGGDHQFAYDDITLSKRLKEVGFTKVRTDHYAPDAQIDQGDSWRLRESLYLVCEKENTFI